MASGTIHSDIVFPSSGSFKLPNGIIFAWDTTYVQTSTTGGTPFSYRGSTQVSVAGYGITHLIAAFANVREGAGYWNASVSSMSETTMDVTAAGNANGSKTVFWLAIGT